MQSIVESTLRCFLKVNFKRKSMLSQHGDKLGERHIR